jgi:class 3 adenylate cyclase
MEIPETRYAKTVGVHLAYQVVGTGSVDLLLVDTWVHHVEAVWEFSDFARLLRRLSSFARLIHFDRRGTGLSDPVPLDALPDIDTQVADAVAVLEAAESREAAILGLNDGTLVAMMLAVMHPERCRSLILFTPTAKHEMAAGMPMEDIDVAIEMMESAAVTGGSGVEWFAPSRAGDERFSDQLARFRRLSVRPGAFRHYYRQSMTAADLSDELPSIPVPTLVMNRVDNRIVTIEQSRNVASLIPNAKVVELLGPDHLVFSMDVDTVVDEIEEFLTGARTGADPDRILATLLFTDIVDSTKRAAELGDRRWRDLLDEHHHQVRSQLERFGGREVSTTGDGFFARFTVPAAAVRCALAIVNAVASTGFQIRAGIHTGEVEVRGSDLGGLAVHIAARVASVAGRSEVLVSSTVRDLIAGSGLTFEDRGEHELKGVPERWRLYRVVSESP